MREDGKIAKTVYVGNGVESIEWIDPPAKKKDPKVEHKAEHNAKAEKPAKD
jgi:hypothetical protein